MKAKLKKFESYNALNHVEMKDLLRDINLEMAELKQEATNLNRDTSLAKISQVPLTTQETREFNKQIIDIDHRSGTLNNHAEYILILLASKKRYEPPPAQDRT